MARSTSISAVFNRRGSNDLDLYHTVVFEKNLNADSRIVCNQGGTRSSKTYSLAQLMVIRAINEQGTVIDICRKTFPALKATVYRDVIDILQELNLYYEEYHNKTDHIYHLGKSEIHFYSVDQPQKIRGRKRHILWLNEANEFDLEDWRQFVLRTTGQVYLDYNPADEYHWIYDIVIPRDDCTFIQSTYKDNEALEPDVVQEIERLKDEDQDYWRVFGLGERGASKETIFTKWDDNWSPAVDETIYGLDFGYNVASALVEIGLKEKDAHIRELIYEPYLTTEDLILKMNQLGISKTAEIYADAAEPDRIDQIHRAGYNIKPANKSVKAGIDKVKSYRLHVHSESVNLRKEIKFYKYKKDKSDRILDEPVKFNDHAMDAMRYGIFTHGNVVKFEPEFKRAK